MTVAKTVTLIWNDESGDGRRLELSLSLRSVYPLVLVYFPLVVPDHPVEPAHIKEAEDDKHDICSRQESRDGCFGVVTDEFNYRSCHAENVCFDCYYTANIAFLTGTAKDKQTKQRI